MQWQISLGARFDEQGGHQTKSLSLYVHKPVIRAFAQSYLPLEESLHLKEWTTKSTKEVIVPSTSSTTTRSREVIILNSSIHDEEPSTTKFTLLFSSFNLGKAIWRAPPTSFGEARYTSLYWEWTEDVLGRYKNTLVKAGVFDSVGASQISYDHCDNVLRAFCKHWCPSTNTLHTSIGELSISLWDLRRLGGLPIVKSSACEWIGVTCGSRHRRLTALNISNMDISGTIPPHLGNLSFLISLDMSGNYFHGELPHELAYLRRLRVLDFSINKFTGEVPSWFGSLQKLQHLYLRNNSFTGFIPPSIANVSNLETLGLSYNFLEGILPEEIGKHQSLKKLIIYNNQLSGSLPLEMFNIFSLESIDFLLSL